MDLFEYAREQNMDRESPLASRLRPETLEEVVGQQHIIGKDKLLYRAIKADKLGSLIFYGPPGTGKTTLAKVIAHTTKAEFTQINATVAGKKDMEEVVRQAKERRGMYGRRTILFVDEIHRFNKGQQDYLLPFVEDGTITLIGATTRAGQLSAPLRDRFGVTLRLELYTPEELALIVTRSAGILEVPIEADGAMEIARRSRGTPRIANRMLRRVRDFAQVRAGGVITKKVADEALTALEIDPLGLDSIDHRMLRSIMENYRGGPVGLETLAATINEESVTLEDVYEPYLMQLGFLTRTPRGRCVTPKAYQHLGLPVPGGECGSGLDQLTL